jgi:membrane fusion protein, multidrug efflux system
MMLEFAKRNRPARLPLIALITIATLTTGCGKEAGTDAQAGAATGKHGKPNATRPEQQAIPVALQAVTTGDIASYYEATATLEAEKEAEVLARVAGLVDRLLVEEGDTVAEGTPLLEVENDEYRLRAKQTAALAVTVRARVARVKLMHEQGGISEEEFQAALSDLAVAEANDGLAQLNLSYTTVRAPFDARVTRRMIDVGQNISQGSPLFLMADFDPLLASVHVPSRELGKLKQNQGVRLSLDSSGERLEGRIKLISPVIDPTSGTIKLTIEIPDYPDGTRPGDFAAVSIVTEKHKGATLVPRGAVISDKGESFVYVAVMGGGKPRGKPGEGARGGKQKPKGVPKSNAEAEEAPFEPVLSAERRVVEIGFTDDDHAEILSGLKPGERIVVKGQRSLKHGVPLKVLEENGAQVDA